jgi:hypothetical protein
MLTRAGPASPDAVGDGLAGEWAVDGEHNEDVASSGW